MAGVLRLFNASSSSATLLATEPLNNSRGTPQAPPSFLPPWDLNRSPPSNRSTSPTSALTPPWERQDRPTQPDSLFRQRLVDSPEPLPSKKPPQPFSSFATRTYPAKPSARTLAKDDFLLSILASEAVLECKQFQCLDSQQLDSLKKEKQTLSSRQEALQRKLKLESKIRDASRSLTKVSPRSGDRGVNAPNGGLDNAQRKVQAIERELDQIAARMSSVNQRLLEHNAGVLSRAFAQDTWANDGEAASLSSDDQSSATSASSVATSAAPTPFSSSHFYAGHTNATGQPNNSDSQVTALQAALDLAKKREQELERDLKHAEMERMEREAALTMELQAAEETIQKFSTETARIAGLEGQIEELMDQREIGERQQEDLRRTLDEQLSQVSQLKSEVDALSRNREKTNEIEAERSASVTELEQLQKKHDALVAQLENARRKWESERQDMELTRAVELSNLEDELSERREDLQDTFDSLKDLLSSHQVDTSTRGEDIPSLVEAIGEHFLQLNFRLQAAETAKAKLEKELAEEERATKLLAIVQRENVTLKADLRAMEITPGVSKTNFPRGITRGQSESDEGSVVSQLKALWSTLPSPESRALKMGSRSPTKGVSGAPSSPLTPSIAELDVRALRSLYDPKTGLAEIPSGEFSVEGFVKRVQMLIADDRAIIERLIRFAQSHELLKNNAERAQRLARESSQALETYQKQVKSLQERNDNLDILQESLNDHLREVQNALEQVRAEKQEMEGSFKTQREQLNSLRAANDVLNARALSLAREQESVRKNSDSKSSGMQEALRKAEEEVDAIRLSEQTQRAALLDELNSMQTEITRLRDQLRAEQRKNGK